MIFIVLLEGLENVWRTCRQSARFLKARRAKINKLLSQKQIGDWSEIFNKSLSQNCIGKTKQKFMQTVLGSSEPIKINLKLTTSNRNAHFIFYKRFIFCGNFRAGPTPIPSLTDEISPTPIYKSSIVHCRVKQE